MKIKHSSKLFYTACAAMVMISSPCFAFVWPTFDVAAVKDIINQGTTKMNGVKSTIDSTGSTDGMSQALGDNVGSMSKFTDKEEDNKKKEEKAEKKRKRAEWIAKKKAQIKKAKAKAAQAKQWYDEEGKDYVAQAKDYYEQAEGYYNDYLGSKNEGNNPETQEQASDQSQNYGSSSSPSEILNQNQAANASAAVEKDAPAKKQVSSPAVTQPAYNMEEESLDNEALAGLIENEEFSEGNWSGLVPEEEAGVQLENSVVIENNLNGHNAEDIKVSPAVTAGTAVVPAAKNIQRRPFIKENPQIQSKSTQVQSESAPKNTVAEKVSEHAVQEDALKSARQAPAVSKAVVPSYQNSGSLVPASDTGSSQTKTNMRKTAAPTLNNVQNTVSGTAGKPLTDAAVMKTNSASTRKAFKTSAVSYQLRMPLSFAQEAGDDFKTGSNEDGKFIYSDIIADKCGMNYDEVTEEKVAACIKTFVMGMNHDNAVTAAEWKNEYTKSRHDHAANDLAVAINQKTFSAAFDSKVADDLDSKSKALTTEREEIAFAGKVNQTNQEIIIRLLESMTGQALTEAWGSIEAMDRTYYEEQED